MAAVSIRATFQVFCVLLILASIALSIDGFLLSEGDRPLGRSTPLKSKLFGPSDFDDEIGGYSDPQEEGDALAKDFHKELQKREGMRSDTKATNAPGKAPGFPLSAEDADPAGSSESAKFAAASTQSTEPPTPPKKKFTGQQDRLFKNSQPPAFSRPSSPSRVQGRTPREAMMEREYQLVGRAEQGIAIQAAVAVAALIFYIYVGMSGGIVSGDEAMMESFGADDEIPFEQLMPVPSDREVSVWL